MVECGTAHAVVACASGHAPRMPMLQQCCMRPLCWHAALGMRLALPCFMCASSMMPAAACAALATVTKYEVCAYALVSHSTAPCELVFEICVHHHMLSTYTKNRK
jgi:hypothetical protein